MRARIHLQAATLVSSLELAACSATPSSNASAPPAEDGGGPSPCSRDGDAYVKGLKRASSGGAFVVELLDVSPDPPAMGANDWTFSLRDPARGPIVGAPLVMTSFMPDHGHPGPSVDVAQRDGGEYGATMNIVLMSGLYRFAIALADRRDDSAAYEFCVR